MKKLLLSVCVLAILGLPKLSAQNLIVNSDFESWSTNQLAVPTAKDPNEGFGSGGWWDFNLMNYYYLGNSPVTVFQDSVNPTPYHGKYCAKIISAAMATSSYNLVKNSGGAAFNYPQINGIILTAYMDFSISVITPTLIIKPGIPCKNGLKSFSFYYRYIPFGGTGNDTCSCTIAMYHYNSVTHARNLVGGGHWSNSATVTSWTEANVPITYLPDSVLVDTVFIGFSACTLQSADNPKAGDTMNIDYASAVLGINNVTEESDKINIYPNPANNVINLSVSGQFQANRVEIYDITGRMVGTYSLQNNFLTINTQSYNNGLYVYKLLDNTGVQLNIGKFSVLR